MTERSPFFFFVQYRNNTNLPPPHPAHLPPPTAPHPILSHTQPQDVVIMPSTKATGLGGVSHVLSETFVGVFTLPLTSFIHTTSGRKLREAGVNDLISDIKQKGWLSNQRPTVCLVGDLPDGGLSVENSGSHQYRMIDGNHRLAALRRLAEDAALSPPTDIKVEVHAGISEDLERHIAISKYCVVFSVCVTAFCIYLCPLS